MKLVLDFFTETDTEHLIDYIKNNYNPQKPLILWVDLFCGAGGVTEGFSRKENSFVIACVNHDENAIRSHHANHPYCIHYTEDIRDFDVVNKIHNLVLDLRIHFPKAYFGLHASLECTHFSRAKGGMSRDADSRTLANHLPIYFKIDFDYITIENVREFLTWGPLYQTFKKSKGQKLYRFKMKKGVKKNPKLSLWHSIPYNGNEEYFDSLKLDPFMLPIKERKKEFYNEWKAEINSHGFKYEYKLLDAADYGAYSYRLRYFGVFSKPHLPIEFPKRTHVKKEKHHLYPDLKIHNKVREYLHLNIHGNSLFGLTKNGKPYAVNTIKRVYYGLIKYWKEGYFTIRYNGGDMSNKSKSINDPLGCILTNNTHSLVKPIFITSYYGNSQNGQGVHSLDEPNRTIPCNDTFALQHLQYAYGKATYSSMDEPSGTNMANPKQELVTVLKPLQFLFDTQYDRVKCDIDRPGPTVIARQDKKPLYVASACHKGNVDHSAWREDDPLHLMLLRTFMREYGIVDIKIRSLFIDELSKIQGFPDDYIFKGTETDIKKYIGNSVNPDTAEALCGSIYNAIEKYEKAA